VSGHIRRRGKQSYELKFDAGHDEKTGKRITQFHTFRGTRKEAEFKLAELVASVGKGAYVARSIITIYQHVAARIDQWEGLGKITAATAERYRGLLENQIKPHIGDIAIQKLKPADVERWHTTLMTSGRRDGAGGLSPRMVRHAHRLVSKALKEGMRHDLVVRNVAASESPPKINADEITVLDGDQIKALVEKLRGRAMYPRAITALFTGIRRGELLALRWHHADLDGKNPVLRVREAIEETKAHGLRIKAPKTKNSIRDVTLPDIVVDALRDVKRSQLEQRIALGLGKLPDDALIFPRLNGAAQSPRAFSKAWADAADGIGFPQITFHAFRHTHASHLIDAGIDVVKISRRLGHASPAITLKIYAHLFHARDDKSADAINAAVAAVLRA
jgi:integrase